MNKVENIFEINTKEYKLGRLSYFNNENILSSIEYNIENGILTLIKLETNKEERNKGYASLLLKRLIDLFGNTFVFKLNCCPLDTPIDTFFEKQEKLSKFYESFGFKTESIEKYGKYTRIWKMKRLNSI